MHRVLPVGFPSGEHCSSLPRLRDSLRAVARLRLRANADVGQLSRMWFDQNHIIGDCNVLEESFLFSHYIN